MTVRSAELARSATAAAVADSALATVPSPETWLLKDITASITSNVAASVRVELARGAARHPVLYAVSGATGNPVIVVHSGFIVLEPGDQIRWTVTGAVTPNAAVWCSGAKLDGVAP